MKTVCKKLLSLMLVAMLLVSAVPFQVFATEGDVTTDPIETTAATEAPVATEAAVAPAAEAAAEPAPAAEGSITNEDVSSQPAVNTIGDLVTVQYVVDVNGETALIKEYANCKAGAKFPAAPGASAVMQVYAQYAGSSAGKKFQQWELDGSYFAPASNYIKAGQSEGDVIQVYAKIVDAPQNITLFANGGKVSSTSFAVTVGQPYGNLPTPTRDHYNFLYWYKTVNGVEVGVNGETIVEDTSALKAKWELKDYTVNYQRYVLGSGWEDSGYGASVPANSTVSVAAGTFPSDAQIAADFAISGYTIIGWEIGETDTAFKAGSTKITSSLVVRPRYQRTVTLQARNPQTYENWSSKTMTVEIGEPIGQMPNPGDRNGFVFTGWTSEDLSIMISTKGNLSNTSAHPNYDPELHGDIFYASYLEAVTVYLYIHTDGNTKTHEVMTRYYAPAAGEFDMSTINMYSIFSKYGDYDDSVDSADGWYTLEEWKNYSAGLYANSAMVYNNVPNNSEFHIMLTNGGTSSSNTSNSGTTNGNNYNNNTSTADPSNPTTGDEIFMAVTVLAVSATALIFFFLNKKRKAC